MGTGVQNKSVGHQTNTCNARLLHLILVAISLALHVVYNTTTNNVACNTSRKLYLLHEIPQCLKILHAMLHAKSYLLHEIPLCLKDSMKNLPPGLRVVILHCRYWSDVLLFYFILPLMYFVFIFSFPFLCTFLLSRIF